MEQVIITIDTLNDAFGDDAESKRLELARILRKMANSLETGVEPTHLSDLNGNVVGLVSYVFPEEHESDK